MIDNDIEIRDEEFGLDDDDIPDQIDSNANQPGGNLVQDEWEIS